VSFALNNTIEKHGMRNIEVDPGIIYLHIHNPMSKQILAKIRTITNILDPRIIYEHVYCN
jgi:hypothetical protein